MVREVRMDLGLDQAGLAAAAHVAVRTVSQIEAGKQTVQLDVLIRTLHAAGLELVAEPRRTAWTPGRNEP